MSSPLQLAGEVSRIVGHGEAHMSSMLEFSLRRPGRVCWSSLGTKQNGCGNEPVLEDSFSVHPLIRIFDLIN